MNESTAKFVSFPGTIHLIDNDHKLQVAAQKIKAAKEFGFDTETKPSFKKGDVFKVALLQLATETDAFLIRLHFISQFHHLKEVFENQGVVKVGLAIRDDLKQLKKTFEFEHKNFFELQTLAKEKGLKNMGLKGLTEEVLNGFLSKGPKLTNWEAQTLSAQQLMYAATDAWVGLKIYRKMMF
jgi:ribonuclease D